MAILIPDVEPARFARGETVQWSKSIPDFPASEGWTLAYSLRGPQKIDLQATAYQTDQYLITIPAASSADFAPGNYHWQAYVSQGSERYLVAFGDLAIDYDLSREGSTYEVRSDLEIALDNAKAGLKSLSEKLLTQTSAEGRSAVLRDVREQKALIDDLTQRVQAEQREIRKRQGKRSGNIVRVKFV